MSKIKIAALIGLSVVGVVAYQNRQPLMEVISQPQTLPANAEDGPSKKSILKKRPRKNKLTTYQDAHKYAIEHKMNLIIWVNYEDKEVENKLTSCVHFHTTKFSDIKEDKAVVVGKLIDGEFSRYDVPVSNANYATIKSILDN